MDHKEKYKKALQVRCGGSRIISDEPVTFEQAIAWLEKQGEKKNTRKREIDDAYLQGICDAKHEIEKQGEKLDADNVWLQNYLSNVICFVNQFKKDFGL